jgi:hypothetical protein
MDELLYREELMWMQHSQVAWLKDGDWNTNYFHSKAADRKKKNTITMLRKSDGHITKDRKEMVSMATEFFKNLYTADLEVDPGQLTDLFESRITDKMNGDLCKEFTDDEIGTALFQVGPLKASGLDGFPARFFQRNWELLSKDVITAIRGFFYSKKMSNDVNEAAIVLLPKKESPDSLKDFRPISLCNVIYKVVSKFLVNRMRPLLNDIVAPTHSAFVPGRLIIDNALIVFECLHALDQGRQSYKKFGALKLDLTKAYDRVDWEYLERVLMRLGFHYK